MSENQVPQAPQPAPGDPYQQPPASPYGAQGQGAPVPPPPTYQYPPQQQQYTQVQDPQKARTNGFGQIEKERWVATLLAFTFGALGIHKFYLGYKTEGIIMLVVAVVGSCIGVGPLVMAVIAIIEGFKYILMSEAEFQATYVLGYKGWL